LGSRAIREILRKGCGRGGLGGIDMKKKRHEEKEKEKEKGKGKRKKKEERRNFGF